MVDDDEDDDDDADTRDEEPDDAFGYLGDFDLERDDALRRLADLEAAALEELDADVTIDLASGSLDSIVDPNHDLRESDGAASDDDDGPLDTTEERDGLRDPDAVAERLEAEDDAAFDHPSVRDAIETGSAFTSTAFADASELEDLELRHQRPSPWGRLDLTVAWRRTWTPHPVTISLGPLPHGPIATRYDTADSLLVLATWSR